MAGRPLVPIFGRRKRHRQALHAELPSQENFGRHENVLQEPTSMIEETFCHKPILGMPLPSANRSISNRRHENLLSPEMENKLLEEESNCIKDTKPIISKNMQQDKGETGKKEFQLIKRQVSKANVKLIVSSLSQLSQKQSDDDDTVLIEVCAMLDSTVSGINTGGVKNFVLRDQRNAVRCSFYEIDRKFPQLGRGTIVRCILRESKDQAVPYQALSIRRSSQEELRILKELGMFCENHRKQKQFSGSEH